MDMQDIIQMLLSQTQQNPATLTNLMQHPYSTISNVTGIENVSSAQASQAVTAMSAVAAGQSIDFGSLANIAAALMGQNNNSVHTLANSILGSGTTHGVDVTNGATTDMLTNIATAVLSNGKLGSSQGSGLDLGSLIQLAGLVLGSK